MGHLIGKPSLPPAAPVLPRELSEDLRSVLLSSLPGDEQGLRALGFEDCVDHPQLPGHRYMEGYFHSLSTRGAVPSVHPRWGCELQRAAAPAALAAFCEAFRRANALDFAALQRELQASPSASLVAEILQREGHFADLSVQVHWGDAVPPEHVGWHVDAANSFLHMALSLQGRRALHARHRVSNGRISQQCAVGPGDDREVFWQEPGSVYLSSPCCFPHAVEYPACGWQDRIVAVQCRLLLGEEELFGMTGSGASRLDVDPKGGTAAIIFRHMAGRGASLRVPSLDEVRAVMTEAREPAAQGGAAPAHSGQ